MRRRESLPRGVVLLEVLIAITILGVAAWAVTALAIGGGRLVVQVRSGEQEVRRASAFMDWVALWSRDDLDRRLGERPQGPWRLRIDRRTSELYEVELRDSSGGSAILSSALYRPLSGASDMDEVRSAP